MSLPPTLGGGPLPVLELIRQNILATLGGISTSRGFQTNVIVTEPTREARPNTDGILVAVDVQLGPAEYNPEHSSCNNLVEWGQVFDLVFNCAQGQSNPANPATAIPADRMVILARSDIEKALDADPHRGGFAANTLPAPPEWFTRSAGEHEGGVVRRYVIYRTNWDDAYVMRA